MVSPTAAAAKEEALVTVTFGEDTGMVSVLDVPFPFNTRPSGGVKVYV